MSVIGFIYPGPVDTPAELVVFRKTLANFIRGHMPPEDYDDTLVTLSVSHLMAFIQGVEDGEKVERELATGLHDSQEALREQLLTAQMRLEGSGK